VGKTVKEKVCVHTSRDIRAVAGQLVKLWIEVFRREKAQGTAKTVKKSTGSSPNAVGGSNKPRVKDVQKCNLTTGKQAVVSEGVVNGDSNCWPSAHSTPLSGDSPSTGQSKV
jgi:lysine-specific histone demethylase 1